MKSTNRILVATLLAVGGFAAAASAGDTDERTPTRTHTMMGRTLVWVAPKTEAPYALTGREEQTRRAEQPRIEFRPSGRAGTTVEVNPQADERD